MERYKMKYRCYLVRFDSLKMFYFGFSRDGIKNGITKRLIEKNIYYTYREYKTFDNYYECLNYVKEKIKILSKIKDYTRIKDTDKKENNKGYNVYYDKNLEQVRTEYKPGLLTKNEYYKCVSNIIEFVCIMKLPKDYYNKLIFNTMFSSKTSDNRRKRKHILNAPKDVQELYIDIKFTNNDYMFIKEFIVFNKCTLQDLSKASSNRLMSIAKNIGYYKKYTFVIEYLTKLYLDKDEYNIVNLFLLHHNMTKVGKLTNKSKGRISQIIKQMNKNINVNQPKFYVNREIQHYFIQDKFYHIDTKNFKGLICLDL